MSTETIDRTEARPSSRQRLPLLVYVLACGTFLMLTTEFVIAGILPEVANALQVSVARSGSLITVFAVGMIIGAPVMTVLTMRLSKRITLVLALIVFVAGHVLVAAGSDFAVLLVARFVTALATGAFWAVAAVVATHAVEPNAGARAMGVVGAGGALATVLGVPIGAFIAQGVGWRGTFWALAGAAAVVAVLVAAFVPRVRAARESVSIRDSLTGLFPWRLWLALLACLTTSGGVLAAYSYINPILTEQAGIPSAFVPLILTGFGIGSFVGTLLGGRFGDAHPGAVTILTPAVTAIILLLMSLITGAAGAMAILVVLLGLFGLSANGVLIHLAVRFSGRAAPLGSALSVSAFNAGTAISTPVAGTTLTTSLSAHGPALVGAIIATLTLVPAILLAVDRRGAGNGARRIPSRRTH
jgi:DHA1 family inner membrane transport protein